MSRGGVDGIHEEDLVVTLLYSAKAVALKLKESDIRAAITQLVERVIIYRNGAELHLWDNDHGIVLQWL